MRKRRGTIEESKEKINRIEDGEEKKKKKKNKLLKYEELPEYLKDNEYILDHYRCEWPLRDVFLSVFSWHNETLNIWTHLVGFLIFVGMTMVSFTDNGFSRWPVSWTLMRSHVNISMNNSLSADSRLNQIPQNSVFDVEKDEYEAAVPKWPWFVFLAGAMGCLVCSSLSHLLACHSKRFNLFFWRLDYAGISLMIVCSFFAPIYYAFSCHPYWRLLYLTSISVLGVLVIITLLAPALSAPRFRPFRAALFLTMGFSGAIPASHVLILHWGHRSILVAIGYELAMAIFYATGAAFYVSRVPERWKPGAFDITGHSHQIFHVLVVLGALAHSVATVLIMDFRRGSPTCAL